MLSTCRRLALVDEKICTAAWAKLRVLLHHRGAGAVLQPSEFADGSDLAPHCGMRIPTGLFITAVSGALFATAGCAGSTHAPPQPVPSPPADSAPAPSGVMHPVVPVTPAQPSVRAAVPAAPPVAAPPAKSAPAPVASVRGPAARPAAAIASSPKPPPAVTAAPPATPAPVAATLNLTDLEQRLRDTKAIGVFTKLSLKNQVDDLLDEFRSLYKGAAKRPSAELRQRYDELLAKVLDLLKSGDPKLANAIASSREAIWGILADPDKFAKI
jgi:hypothetical protein